MKTIIRSSVFETNSSSTHSLSIGSHVDFVTIVPDYNGEISVYPEEFGWAPEDYTDAQSRLAYFLIYVRDWVADEDRKQRYESLLKEMVCEHTGATDVFLTEGTSRWTNGYIDHQSVEHGDLDHIFEAGKDELKAYIFGVGGYVHTDNDNC